MFHLVYSSLAIGPVSSRELLDLLPFYREKNSRLGITGLLLCKRGEYMQALEGEEAAVRALYEVIRQDRRHHDIRLLAAMEVPRRQFPRWTMGFRNLDEEIISPVPGYSPYPDLPSRDERGVWKHSIAIGMLAAFMHE